MKLRKAKAYVSVKNGQIKASPIESEIHPSHKPAVYTLCISRLHRARRSCSQVHLARAAYPRGFAPRIALAGGRHHRKSAAKQRAFSLVPMAFPCRQRPRTAMQPGAHTNHRSVRKTHERPNTFCRNHLASRCDDSAKMSAALFARKRAYARNRFA